MSFCMSICSIFSFEIDNRSSCICIFSPYELNRISLDAMFGSLHMTKTEEIRAIKKNAEIRFFQK